MEPLDLDAVTELLDAELHPYRDRYPVHRTLPATGRDRAEVLEEMRALAEAEEPTWRQGYASGAVYHGGEEHVAFLDEVYALNSQTNPLHPELWPSAVKFEAEIVAMTAAMLGGGSDEAPRVSGTVTSGGTESIVLAMKAYRDWGRHYRGIEQPKILVPLSAHVAFDKAAQLLGLQVVPVPLTDALEADTQAAADLVDDDTVAIVGSAPGFPHGIIDPIDELSEIAYEHDIGFHTDACLGAFVLPWAARLGYEVPRFDFTLRGVTSMSADTHKFGYAAKGTSVVLYRTPELRRYQYYRNASWMGGLYFSPTVAGSRSGALSAQCWAAMVTFGEEGYLVATRAVLQAAATIRQGIESIDGLSVLGDPLWVIAFGSDELDIYAVGDQMNQRGWRLNGLQHPAALHICTTLRHAQPGVAERFVEDLRASVEEVRRLPAGHRGAMAPIYGMTGALETRGAVEDLLERYGDLQFEV